MYSMIAQRIEDWDAKRSEQRHLWGVSFGIVVVWMNCMYTCDIHAKDGKSIARFRTVTY
jgi:hypothetical protein